MKEAEPQVPVDSEHVADSESVGDSVTEPNERRKRPIATLVVLLLSVLAGCFAVYLRTCLVQVNAIAKLTRHGADIQYEPSPYTSWLKGILPKEVVDRVVEVKVVEAELNDASVLVDLPNIRKLWLVSTEIYDISPLARLWELEELVLDGSPVRDLSPLQGLEQLQVVRFSDTEVRDLTPLAALNLTRVFFSDTPVRDLGALHEMKTLESIQMANTRIRSLEPLGELPELRSIKMDHSNVNDLRPLEKMKKLNSVSFTGLPIVPSQLARLDVFLPEWECRAFRKNRSR